MLGNFVTDGYKKVRSFPYSEKLKSVGFQLQTNLYGKLIINK